MVTRRDYLEKIKPFIGLNVVKVATGIRRCGKSVLLRQIRDMIEKEIDPSGKFISINFEEDENRHLRDVLLEREDLKGLMSKEDILAAMDPKNYTGGSREIVDKMVAQVEKELKIKV